MDGRRPVAQIGNPKSSSPQSGSAREAKSRLRRCPAAKPNARTLTHAPERFGIWGGVSEQRAAPSPHKWGPPTTRQRARHQPARKRGMTSKPATSRLSSRRARTRWSPRPPAADPSRSNASPRAGLARPPPATGEPRDRRPRRRPTPRAGSQTPSPGRAARTVLSPAGRSPPRPHRHRSSSSSCPRRQTRHRGDPRRPQRRPHRVHALEQACRSRNRKPGSGNERDAAKPRPTRV